MGADLKGPYAGHDIAVYRLTDESKSKVKKTMRTDPDSLRPACLPRREYPSQNGQFAGWLDQEPYYRQEELTVDVLERQYGFLRTVRVREAAI